MRTTSKLLELLICACLLTLSVIGRPALAEDAAQTSAPRTAAQVEQLVAPIALYPDSLLSQILMASTYPLEVIAAARWAQSNPSVTGDALVSAMAKEPWDPSVKALTAVPQTLQLMNDKLDWTQQLGDAFLAQQEDVLAAVQRLRARADANGNLKSTPEQTVTKVARAAAPATSGVSEPAAAPPDVYTIEPTNPEQYYVPVYDPGEVYGAWPYPDSASFYWYPLGFTAGRLLAFGAGVFVGAAIWGNIDWLRNRVGINPLRYNRFNRTNITSSTWVHNAAHRGAVPYRDANVAQRFGSQNRAAAREAFRGQADAGRRELNRERQGNQRQARNTGNQKQARNSGNQRQARNTGQQKQARAGAGRHTAQNSRTARNNQVAHRSRTAGHTQRSNASRGRATSANAMGSNRAMRGGGGGGARAAGSGRGGGGHGGGRRSDIRLKDDIVLLGHLNNELGFYRFRYHNNDKLYVGVMAQEVQAIMPRAVKRDPDGYYRVFYGDLGLKFQSYQQWLTSGGKMPTVSRVQR